MTYGRRLLYIWAEDEAAGAAIRRILKRDRPDLVVRELSLDAASGRPLEDAVRQCGGIANNSPGLPDTERLARLIVAAGSSLEERIGRLEGLVQDLFARIAPDPLPQVAGDAHSAGILQLDMEACSVSCGARRIALTASEALVAREILQSPDSLLTREHLHRVLYGRAWVPGKRSVDVHVARLRRKLAEVTGLLRIEAVRARGYRLRCFSPGGMTLVLDGSAPPGPTLQPAPGDPPTAAGDSGQNCGEA